MTTTTEAPTWAYRVNATEARYAFEHGARVAVSEHGSAELLLIGPLSTLHDRTTTTWKALAEEVREWRPRYPYQHYYVVNEH